MKRSDSTETDTHTTHIHNKQIAPKLIKMTREKDQYQTHILHSLEPFGRRTDTQNKIIFGFSDSDSPLPITSSHSPIHTIQCHCDSDVASSVFCLGFFSQRHPNKWIVIIEKNTGGMRAGAG